MSLFAEPKTEGIVSCWPITYPYLHGTPEALTATWHSNSSGKDALCIAIARVPVTGL